MSLLPAGSGVNTTWEVQRRGADTVSYDWGKTEYAVVPTSDPTALAFFKSTPINPAGHTGMWYAMGVWDSKALTVRLSAAAYSPSKLPFASTPTPTNIQVVSAPTPKGNTDLAVVNSDTNTIVATHTTPVPAASPAPTAEPSVPAPTSDPAALNVSSNVQSPTTTTSSGLSTTEIAIIAAVVAAFLVFRS